MKRCRTGEYQVTVIGSEEVRAFVPTPLPPTPALAFDAALRRSLESAALALGRLDSVSALLPDKMFFLYSYVRKEAVLSSQIEGTQSSLSDLLLFELDEALGVPLDDVREVSNYVAALEHGIKRLAEDFPLSKRFIREIHKVLLSHGRGSQATPGEFRRSQNWIGGTRPGDAKFVPPPHTAVPDCMTEFERFLHAEEDKLSVLVRAGLAHVQFETIHPFLDGNGRVGRLLITLLLCHYKVLHEPILYLSLYFKQNRDTYYELLDRVRHTGDWEAWLTFFFEGIRQTSDGAVSTAKNLGEMFQAHRDWIENIGRRAGSTLRVHDALKERPILSLTQICNRTQLSLPAVSSAVKLLVEKKIVREITRKRRNRLFAYDQYLTTLNEGTEALSDG